MKDNDQAQEVAKKIAASPQPTHPSTGLSLSSKERMAAKRLTGSIIALLNQEMVQKVLAQINKGEIVIEVRHGLAKQITPAPALRSGKELPPA